MLAAREAGIDFLDDARYNDETGTRADPDRLVRGRLRRAVPRLGWPRDEVVVANKLWWEFWPEQDAASELDASLRRMGLDHLDLATPRCRPRACASTRSSRQAGALIESGKRAPGACSTGPPTCSPRRAGAPSAGRRDAAAVQLPYSLVRRSPVEDPGRAQHYERAARASSRPPHSRRAR